MHLPLVPVNGHRVRFRAGMELQADRQDPGQAGLAALAKGGRGEAGPGPPITGDREEEERQFVRAAPGALVAKIEVGDDAFEFARGRFLERDGIGLVGLVSADEPQISLCLRFLGNRSSGRSGRVGMGKQVAVGFSGEILLDRF